MVFMTVSVSLLNMRDKHVGFDADLRRVGDGDEHVVRRVLASLLIFIFTCNIICVPYIIYIVDNTRKEQLFLTRVYKHTRNWMNGGRSVYNFL
jgi:hypothetical protein